MRRVAWDSLARDEQQNTIDHEACLHHQQSLQRSRAAFDESLKLGVQEAEEKLQQEQRLKEKLDQDEREATEQHRALAEQLALLDQRRTEAAERSRLQSEQVAIAAQHNAATQAGVAQQRRVYFGPNGPDFVPPLVSPLPAPHGHGSEQQQQPWQAPGPAWVRFRAAAATRQAPGPAWARSRAATATRHAPGPA